MIFQQITSYENISIEDILEPQAEFTSLSPFTGVFKIESRLSASEIFEAFEINSCTCLSLLFIVIVKKQIPILPGTMASSSDLNGNVRHVLHFDDGLQDEMENISWLYRRCNHGKLNGISYGQL